MHRTDRLLVRCAESLTAILLTCAAFQQVHAAQLKLQWDYEASGAAGFVLYCGASSGAYTTRVDVGNTETYTLTGLQENRTYYCAVTAYDPGRTESGYSNQVSFFIPYLEPETNFTPTPAGGVAPLTVAFDNTTTGQVSTWSWNFGDQTTSSAKNPTKIYSAPGSYTVTLTATGPGGSATKSTTIQVSSPASSNGLVVAYGFEEGAGTSVSDASGRGNTGAIKDAAWAAQGRFGKALWFNGTTSWVTVNDSGSLDLSAGMTLAAWVYPTGGMTGWRDIIIKETSGSAVYYLSASSDAGPPAAGVSSTDHEVLYGPSGLPPGTWTHLAATYDGARLRLYVNGVEVASRAQSGALNTSSSPLRIGANNVWREYFQGLIDEVRVYNRALSVSELRASMNSPVAPPP